MSRHRMTVEEARRLTDAASNRATQLSTNIQNRRYQNVGYAITHPIPSLGYSAGKFLSNISGGIGDVTGAVTQSAVIPTVQAVGSGTGDILRDFENSNTGMILVAGGIIVLYLLLRED